MSRPVGYGMIRADLRTDSMIGTDEISNGGTHLQTGETLGLAAPDQTVPYGTVLARTLSQGSFMQATIMLSLWDENILRA